MGIASRVSPFSVRLPPTPNANTPPIHLELAYLLNACSRPDDTHILLSAGDCFCAPLSSGVFRLLIFFFFKFKQVEKLSRGSWSTSWATRWQRRPNLDEDDADHNVELEKAASLP